MSREYDDIVVEVNVEVPQAVASPTGGDFQGIFVKDTPTIQLIGRGTEEQPLIASAKISKKDNNQLQAISSGPDQGLFVPPTESKVSSKSGNTVVRISAEEAVALGDPTLEGLYADPLHKSTTSPRKTLQIKPLNTADSKSTMDVAVDEENESNVLVISEKGLSVSISKVLDNTLEIKEGKTLYVRPQETKISADPDNKIEIKPDGIFVQNIKGDQGVKGDKGDVGPRGEQGPKGDKGDPGAPGEKGDIGLGIHVIANLSSINDLPAVEDYNDGDTFVIEGHFWTRITSGGTPAWEDLGSFIGPEGMSSYEVAVREGFVGTPEEWLKSLKGADGIGLRILGSFSSVGQLPATGNTSGDAYIVSEQMWVWDTQQWSPVGQVGPEGKSAYEVWLSQGNTGTINDFLASIKGSTGDTGPRGEKGDKGDAGTNANVLNLRGSKPTEGDLPPAGNQIGDAYVVGSDVFGWTGARWENYGPIRGPKGEDGAVGEQGPEGPRGVQGIKGDKGDKGDIGFTGPRGLNGERGEKGETGAGLELKGSKQSPSELPTEGNEEGDAWLVGDNIYIWSNGDWKNNGPFRGPAGKDGEKGIAGPKGDKGDAGPTGQTGAKGDVGPQGPAGPKGDTGAALTPKGTKPTVDDLPSTGNVQGDMWTVSGVGYVWNGTAWQSIGTIQGPKGDTGPSGLDGAKGETGDRGEQGPEGPMGPEGPQGEKGDQGSGVDVLGKKDSEDDLPSTGELGKGYIVGQDFWVWTGSAYENVGPIQGPKGDQGIRGVPGAQGPVGDKGAKGDKGDQGNIWVVLSRDPQPTDGQQVGDIFMNKNTLEYWRKTSATEWSSQGHIGGGNVYDATADGKRKVRLDGEWVNETQAQKISIINPTTPVIDLSRQTVAFTLDNSTNTTKSVSFTNPPSSEFMLPITLVIKGSSGDIAWPSNVKWSGGTLPAYGKAKTVLVFLWDGTEFIATLGPNY
jgi:hypothetical protein